MPLPACGVSPTASGYSGANPKDSQLSGEVLGRFTHRGRLATAIVLAGIVALVSPSTVHAALQRTPSTLATERPTTAQTTSPPALDQAGTTTPPAGNGLVVVDLTVDHLTEPVGVDSHQPRFSWNLSSGGRDKSQMGYQIQVSESKESLQSGIANVWDTGFRASSEQTLVPYAGPNLSSGTSYFWRVRVWDEGNAESPWSPMSTWSTALLHPEDWKASWIRPSSDEAGGSYLRKSFRLPAEPVRATAFVAGRGTFERPLDYQGYCCLQTSTLARGIYELSANGSRVGDAELESQPTDSRIRSLYRTWDVTSILHAGDNAVGFLIGEDSDVVLQINIEWPDGPATVVSTDSSWTSRPGPVTRAHKFHGETFDARKQQPGWNTAEGGGQGWSPVRVNPDLGTLESAPNEPMRVVDKLTPVKINQPAPGVYVADFGKNISGSVALSLVIPEGETVTIKHGERLLNGRVDNTITQALQTSTFIGDGKTSEFGARFGYAGYRWAEISGLDGFPPPGSLIAREIRSDVAATGGFESSTLLLNSLHAANRQTQANGLHGIPEDTPTREKRGWMADAHLAAEASINNYDMAAFYTKFIQDMEDAQKPSGFVPDIVPIEQGAFWNEQSDPAWSAATVLIPYYVWKSYGDDNIISGHYDSMDSWMSYIRTTSDGYLLTRPSMTWGQDWVAAEQTDSKLFQTGFYYLSAKLMAEMASSLEKPDDAIRYTALAANIAEAFNDRYFDAGRASYGESQFSNAFPLTLGIVPAGRADDVTKTLVHQVMVLGGGHVRGGLPGAKYIVDALELMGRSDIVNIVVSRTDSPGWAYMLTHGPGSIWEEWQGSPSLNHPMFTFIDNWLYTSVAGISQSKEAGGYREVVFDPKITGQLSSASGSVATPYGKARIAWNAADGRASYLFTVPVGSTGKLIIRKTKPESAAESGKLITVGNGIRSIAANGEDTIVTLGSGDFTFTTDPALAELAAATEISAEVAAKVTSASMTEPGISNLLAPSARIGSAVNAAVSAQLRPDHDSNIQLGQAIDAAAAFTEAVMASRSAGLSAAVADEFALGSARTIIHLSSALDAAGVMITALATEQRVAPGWSTDVVISVKNSGETELRHPSTKLQLPAGWSGRLMSPFPETIPANGEARAVFDVTPPEDSIVSAFTATSMVTFANGPDTVTKSVPLQLEVGPDLAIEDAGLQPRIVQAGGRAYAAVKLRSLQTSTDKTVHVKAARLPQGWTADAPVTATVPAGGEITVLVPVTSGTTSPSGTVALEVKDESGRASGSAHTWGLVRGSANCASDLTGEACLPQSSRILANFEGGSTDGWKAPQESGVLPQAVSSGGWAAPQLGISVLNLSAERPVLSPAWRETSATLDKAVSTGDSSALTVSLRLKDPKPGVPYEARLTATDSTGHVSDMVRAVAPGSWNLLVLPTAESGLVDIASVGLSVRSTAPNIDSGDFAIDALRLEYGHGGLNLAAGANASVGSSTETGGWSVSNLLDSVSFSTSQKRGYRSEATGAQWIQLDLGKSLEVGSIWLHPATVPAGEEPVASAPGPPASPVIELSDNGTEWVKSAVAVEVSSAPDNPMRLILDPVKSRFIRLTAPASGNPAQSVLSLSEIEVFRPGNSVIDPVSDQAVEQGDPALFVAPPPGRPGTELQWQRSGDGGVTFSDIAGARNTTLVVPLPKETNNGDVVRTVTVTQDGHDYRSSRPAVLTVRSGVLAITEQPRDLYLALASGSGGQLIADATGAGRRLQWQRSENAGLSWKNVSDGNGPALPVSLSQGSALPGEKFRLVATNLLGERVVSETAAVNLGEQPRIAVPALNVAALPGKDVELNVTVSGAPTPTVIWSTQQNPDGPWIELTADRGGTLRVTSSDVRNGARYRAEARNSFGVASSSEIVLSVLAPAGRPPEPNSPAGDTAENRQRERMPITGTTMSPLFTAAALILAGTLLVVAPRAAFRRRLRASVRKEFRD